MDTKLRVMLIDDSKTMRNIQRTMLTQMGFETLEEAQDGQDALSKLGAFRPELILCDWNMPNLDGLEFVKQARSRGCTAPIIMVTTESEKTKVVTAIRAGVNNYVVKPFTQEVLAARITETLSKVKAAA
ncbi:MAG: response regulator [Phycisphaerae bacterium]|jgi:two-component system chemotaxis response regulator CheY|nr:response regulator [Phycisphaerae bacterium]